MFFTPERIALLLCLVGGYLFGLIQSGYFIAKLKKVDIKNLGSGNTGATNTWRVMGAPWGLLTLLIDAGKTVLAIFIATSVLTNILHYDIPYITIVLYTGLGVVLGHDFPCYLKFKGGKGIACSFAIFACFKQWQYIIVGVVVFFIVLLVSRYVSLASIITMVFELATLLLCMLLNITYVNTEWKTDTTVIICLLVALAIFTHRSNIVRLFYGEEAKFRFRKYDLNEDSDDEDDEDYDNEEYDADDEEFEVVEAEVAEKTEVVEDDSAKETETDLEETEEIETEQEVEEEIETDSEEAEEIEETEEVAEEIIEEESEEIKEAEAEKETSDQSLPRVTKVVLANWKQNE